MAPMIFLTLCFSIILVPLIAESVTSWRAIRTAEKRFPALWEHSGSPTLVANGDLMKAWPLVKYYRDRTYFDLVTYDGIDLPPIKDPQAIDFAEKLRRPLLLTYWAAWIGAGFFLVIFIGGGIILY